MRVWIAFLLVLCIAPWLVESVSRISKQTRDELNELSVLSENQPQYMDNYMSTLQSKASSSKSSTVSAVDASASVSASASTGAKSQSKSKSHSKAKSHSKSKSHSKRHHSHRGKEEYESETESASESESVHAETYSELVAAQDAPRVDVFSGEVLQESNEFPSAAHIDESHMQDVMYTDTVRCPTAHVREITGDDFESCIHDKNTVVFFYGPTCVHTNSFTPLFDCTSAEFLSDDLQFVKISTAEPVTKKYAVATPTVRFFSSHAADGDDMGWLYRGNSDAHELASWVTREVTVNNIDAEKRSLDDVQVNLDDPDADMEDGIDEDEGALEGGDGSEDSIFRHPHEDEEWDVPEMRFAQRAAVASATQARTQLLLRGMPEDCTCNNLD